MAVRKLTRVQFSYEERLGAPRKRQKSGFRKITIQGQKMNPTLRGLGLEIEALVWARAQFSLFY